MKRPCPLSPVPVLEGQGWEDWVGMRGFVLLSRGGWWDALDSLPRGTGGGGGRTRREERARREEPGGEENRCRVLSPGPRAGS